MNSPASAVLVSCLITQTAIAVLETSEIQVTKILLTILYDGIGRREEEPEDTFGAVSLKKFGTFIGSGPGRDDIVHQDDIFSCYILQVFFTERETVSDISETLGSTEFRLVSCEPRLPKEIVKSISFLFGDTFCEKLRVIISALQSGKDMKWYGRYYRVPVCLLETEHLETFDEFWDEDIFFLLFRIVFVCLKFALEFICVLKCDKGSVQMPILS